MKIPAVAILVALGFLSLECRAQALPDVARQERSRQTQPRQGRVFTNENIPDTRRVTTPRAAPAEPAAERPLTDQAPVTPERASTEVTPPEDRTEEQWRNLFAEARQELSRSEELVTLRNQELADLNQQLLTRSDIFNREQILPPLIQAKEQELLAARERVEAASRTIVELQASLRRAGQPAGWARP